MNEHEFKVAVLGMMSGGRIDRRLRAEVQRRMGEHGNRCPLCKCKCEAYKGIVEEGTGKIVRKTYRCRGCDFEWDINRRDKTYDVFVKANGNGETML